MTCNSLCEFHTLDRLRHVSALPENRLRRRHVLKSATQLPCIRRLTFRRFSFQLLITSLPRFPRSIVTFIGDRFSFLPISLFQHSHSTFVIILFRPFLSAVHQPDYVRMSTFPQTDNHSWSCRTSILEGAIFHKMSYCKFLQGNPCKAIETFYRLDFCLWDFGFSMIFAHSAA